MAASSKKLLMLSLLLALALISLPGSKSLSENPALAVIGNGLDWSFSYGDVLDEEGYGADAEADEDDDDVGDRRSLFWLRRFKYISYGALSANRVPCPPRSGRSYYTHNCFKAGDPAHPYSRGCSMISRCRR